MTSSIPRDDSNVEINFISLSTVVYGAERSLLTLTALMGQRVQITCPEGDLADRARLQGIPVRIINDSRIVELNDIGTRVRGLSALWTVVRAIGPLKKMIRRNGACTHVSFSQWLNLSVTVACRLDGRRAVIDFHDGPFSRAGRLVQRVAASISNANIFTSLVSQENVGGRRLWDTIIPRPIDMQEHSNADMAMDGAWESSTLRLVMIARLVPHKRVEQACAAVASCRDRGLSVSMAVLGDDMTAGETLSRLRGEFPEVWFTGQIEKGSVIRVLKSSHVHISIAENEAFGRAVFEAAALGVPSIVAASSHAASVINNGATGWVIDPNQEAALSDLIGGLSPALAAAAGRSAKRELSSTMEIGRCVDAYRYRIAPSSKVLVSSECEKS